VIDHLHSDSEKDAVLLNLERLETWFIEISSLAYNIGLYMASEIECTQYLTLHNTNVTQVYGTFFQDFFIITIAYVYVIFHAENK